MNSFKKKIIIIKSIKSGIISLFADKAKKQIMQVKKKEKLFKRIFF